MDTVSSMSNRERARALFVDRLSSSGVRPYGKQTVAQHVETLKKLGDYASHLSEQSLDALADEVLVAAAQAKGVCPSELAIRMMVDGKEPRPFEMAPIVTSWLASIEGPPADAGGYLAQLYRHLRNHPRPVMVHDLTAVKKQAAADRQREAVIRERAPRGGATEEELRWLSALVEDLRRARAIVEAGEIARREKHRAMGDDAE